MTTVAELLLDEIVGKSHHADAHSPDLTLAFFGFRQRVEAVVDDLVIEADSKTCDLPKFAEVWHTTEVNASQQARTVGTEWLFSARITADQLLKVAAVGHLVGPFHEVDANSGYFEKLISC